MRKSHQLSPQEFLLDENVSAKTLKRLKKLSLVVRSIKTEQLLGTKNGHLLSLCKQKNWILITHDQDFLSPMIQDHAGIIVVTIHPAIDSVSGVILANFFQSIDVNQIPEKIIILERSSWRFKT